MKNTKNRYIQFWDCDGWNDYVWGDGLRGAKSLYRKVRIVEKKVGLDGFFVTPYKVLVKYKDGKKL